MRQVSGAGFGFGPASFSFGTNIADMGLVPARFSLGPRRVKGSSREARFSTAGLLLMATYPALAEGPESSGPFPERLFEWAFVVARF
jgi:hypothetical protein